MSDIFDTMLQEYAETETTTNSERDAAARFVEFVHQSLARDVVTAYLVDENALVRQSGTRLILPGIPPGDPQSTQPMLLGPFGGPRQAASVTWPHAVPMGPRTSQ